MQNSPYLDAPVLSERERRLADALRRADANIRQLCDTINVLAGRRKVRAEDFTECDVTGNKRQTIRALLREITGE